MFRQARTEKAALLLDEADSFLRNRATASQRWEVTQVNELLVQMEHFQGLVICSTNLVDSLDEASLRRFALKICFDFMKPEQRVALFCRVLVDSGAADPEAELDVATVQSLGRLHRLTPGDFAAARARAQVLGQAMDEAGLLSALVEECRLKPGQRNTLGFAA